MRGKVEPLINPYHDIQKAKAKVNEAQKRFAKTKNVDNAIDLQVAERNYQMVKREKITLVK